MKHRVHFVLFVVLLLLLACNAPAPAAPPTATPLPPPTAIPDTPTPVPPPTAALPPADISFTIDCSALDASRQPDCDSFIATTRDVVYPILREITGVSLSTCFREIHYTILPTDPAPGVGGFSSGDQITYNEAYSVDLPNRYDVHEVLHSFSQCGGALDAHIFHGAILNMAYARLGVFASGYFTDRANAAGMLTYLLEKIPTSTGSDLNDQCRGVIANHMTLVYFDVGDFAIPPLYRATINPQPVNAPNQQLVNVWGDLAPKVEVLLEKLETDYKYVIDVPACGY